MNECDQVERLLAAVAKLKACTRTSASGPTYLEQVVKRIRKTALADFEERELPRFRRLHHALAVTGVPLAALSVCGYGTAEARYTQLLRYFLDPRAAHGLKARVLRAVLKPEMEDAGVPLDAIDYEGAKVEAEVALGKVARRSNEQGCVLDLLISFDGFHVPIEHKITSPESGSIARDQYTQLERYTRAIEAHRADIRRDRSLWLFLTPNRKLPKVDSHWRPVSHGDLVIRCLSILEQELGDVARFNLCSLVWDLLTGPSWWQAEDLLNQFRYRVGEVVANPDRSFAMKRWCAAHGIDWTATLKIVEAYHGETNETSR
jgi:PD-(D/E)XK nuclease superfamily